MKTKLSIVFLAAALTLLVFSAGRSSYTTVVPAYGALYEDAGVTGITVTTAGTYYQWTSSTVSLSTLTTPSSATDNITIGTNGEGVYLISARVSASSTAPPSNVKMAVFVNGTRQAHITGTTEINVTGNEDIAVSGLVLLAVGDVIDVRFTADQNGDVVTPETISIIATRLRRI